MLDTEKILKIMEENKTPLKARTISKLIYEKFDEYKISRFGVRKILWDKNGLRNLVNYNKEDYTYSLQSNVQSLKKVAINDDFVFKAKIKKFQKVRDDNNVINHKVEGDQVEISHCIDKHDIEKVIIGITKTELEFGNDYKKIFNKLKANISKAINDSK